MKRWNLDWLVQIVLAGVLIAGVIYSCRPADTGQIFETRHDSATCPECLDPASSEDLAHDILVGLEMHLKLCGECREAGLTPARMATFRTPTPCYITEAPSRVAQVTKWIGAE